MCIYMYKRITFAEAFWCRIRKYFQMNLNKQKPNEKRKKKKKTTKNSFYGIWKKIESKPF